MLPTSKLVRALILPLALAASVLACAADPDAAAPESEPSLASARAQASPRVAVEADDPTCGLPAPSAHFMQVAHAAAIRGIARVGDRVISQDARRWVLWDVESRKAIATGPVRGDFRVVDLAGSIALTPSADGRDVEVRSARDGRVTATLPIGDAGPGTRLLARDGSYVYVGTKSALRVFDPAGRMLFRVEGDYASIHAYAAPTELRVAQALGVETFDLTGARVHATSFVGFFSAWFVDGAHYTTSASDGVRVFTAAGELVRFFPHRFPLDEARAGLATAGDGPFLWIQDPSSPYRFQGRRLDDGSAIEPVDGDLAQGPNLARVTFSSAPRASAGELRIFEVTKSRYPSERRVPAETYLDSGFSVDAAGNWASGGYRGEVHVSKKDATLPPYPLGCAQPLAIAGARDRVAVLTSDGRIRVFDVVEGAARWQRTIDVLQDAYTAELAFAGDGRYLVVHRRPRGDGQWRASVYVFDLALQQPGQPAPSLELRYGTDAESLRFVVTPHGEHIAIGACSGGPATGTTPTCEVHVSKLDGSMYWKTLPVPSLGTMSLHPDGDRVAVTAQPYVQGLAWFQMPLDTRVFDAQKGLVLTVPNTAVGTFLDADRLLVRTDLSVRVIGRDGTTLASPPGKLLVDYAPLSSEDPAYFFQRAYVHRTDDGAVVWRPTALLEPIKPEDELRTNRITGFALVGDYVAVGVDDYVQLERYR